MAAAWRTVWVRRFSKPSGDGQDCSRASRSQCAGVQMRVQRLIRVAGALTCVITACTGMACSGSPVTPPDGPSPTPFSTSFELSGIAIGDDGRPVPNAPLQVNFVAPGGGASRGLAGMTDDGGRYQVQFDAVRGGYLVARQHRSGSEATTTRRSIAGSVQRLPTSHQTLDLRPQLIRYIAAGESVLVGSGATTPVHQQRPGLSRNRSGLRLSSSAESWCLLMAS